MRLIPTRAAIYGVLAAIAAGFLAWLRIDAKRDLKRDLNEKDHEHATEIQDRVSDNRSDPDRLHPYDDAGYRD